MLYLINVNLFKLEVGEIILFRDIFGKKIMFILNITIYNKNWIYNFFFYKISYAVEICNDAIIQSSQRTRYNISKSILQIRILHTKNQNNSSINLKRVKHPMALINDLLSKLASVNKKLSLATLNG